MTYLTYEFFRNRYENTKPIRGRAEDVRPLGKRRRDWELLVKDTRADGVWYGARLYRTNVVMYSPDGRIEFRTGGYASVSTAEFISAHSPFRATKTRGQVWVLRGDQKVPILHDKVVTFKQEGDDWKLITEIKLTQKVVDRSKSKAVRERIKGFEKYATTMLKLADGWVRASTTEQWRYTAGNDASMNYQWKSYKYNFGFEQNVLLILQGHKLSKWQRQHAHYAYEAYLRDLDAVLEMLSVEDVDTWDRAMYCILEKVDAVRKVEVSSVEYQPYPNDSYKARLILWDEQYSVSAIKNFISKLIKQMDVYTTREVDTSCIRDNLVI
jgi:hypothetical protein